MNQEMIKLAKAEFGLTYHVEYAAIAEAAVGLKGKRVLEIGGSLPARFCLEVLGARQWICIDEPTYWQEIHDGHVGAPAYVRDLSDVSAEDTLPDYTVLRGRVEDLPENLHGRFDIVFSIAAFEHITNLGLALERMHDALAPGGRLFSRFAPVWSAFEGHHLPAIVDRSGRQFNVGQSPIPPWGHLLMRPAQLYHHLLSHTDKETAARMVYFVYHSPHINRLFPEDYIEYFKRSPFFVEKFDFAFPAQGNEDYVAAANERLILLYPTRKHFKHSGISVVMNRRT